MKILAVDQFGNPRYIDDSKDDAKDHNKEQLSATDSTYTIMLKMGQGHPGAAMVLYWLMSNPQRPDDILIIVSLDRLDIRGERLWTLYSDCCDKDLEILRNVIKANSSGKLSKDEIDRHIDADPVRGERFDPAELEI